MKHKRYVLWFSIVALLALLTAGCGQEVPAQSSESLPTVASTTAVVAPTASTVATVSSPTATALPLDTPVPPTDTPPPHTVTPAPTDSPSPVGSGGGVIAFSSNRDGDYEIYLINVDGSGLRQLTDNAFDEYTPAWSPDGTRLAFVSDRDGNDEIYMLTIPETGDPTDGDAVRLTQSSAADGFPAWSPDGTQIAFDSGRDGNWEVYVLPVPGETGDDAGPRPLSGHSADDGIPTWSPDGSRIAFESIRDGNWELYVMDAGGTNQQRLTDNAAHDGFPAWSPDGRQVAFASNRSGAMDVYVLAIPDGADPTVMEPQRLTDNAVHDGFPAWSPDGRQIVFSSERDGNAELYVMDASGANQRRLTHDPAQDIHPAWRPGAVPVVLEVPQGVSPVIDGRLLPDEWAGALRAELSDGSALLLQHAGGYLYMGLRAQDGPGVGSICLDQGERVSVLHSSAALGTAVYQRGGDVWAPVQTFSWDCRDTGSGQQAEQERQEHLEREGWLANNGNMGVPEEFEFQIAMPTGELRLALVYMDPSASFSAWPAGLADGCRDARLIQGPVPTELDFAPEAWVTLRASPSSMAGPGPELAPPVDTPIVFVSTRTGNAEIYLASTDGVSLTRLTETEGDNYWPAWSPDGSRIAFESTRDGNFEIYVVDADGSSPRRLTDHGADDMDPTWSPDGSQIAFQSMRDGNWEIYRMNADGTGLQRLTNHAALDYTLDWSPDGSRIAFGSRRDGGGDIYVLELDGGGLTRLVTAAGEDYAPAWSPDGTRIAFASERDGDWEIYVMAADGQDQRRLTYDPALDSFPRWSPDGRQIVFASDRNGDLDLFALDLDSGEVRFLLDSGSDDWGADWWGPRAADVACSRHYPNVESTFYELVDELNANPISLDLDEGTVVVDGYVFADTFFQLLYSPGAIPWIPLLIDNASHGVYEETSIFAIPDSSKRAWGMHYSTWCREEVSFESLDQALALAAGLPPIYSEIFAAAYEFTLCPLWQSGVAPAVEDEAVVSDIPALVLSGRYDPVTPPAYGELAARTLVNSFVYEFPNLAHGAMRSDACALEIGLQFLDDPTTEPDSSCMEGLGAPEFE